MKNKFFNFFREEKSDVKTSNYGIYDEERQFIRALETFDVDGIVKGLRIFDVNKPLKVETSDWDGGISIEYTVCRTPLDFVQQSPVLVEYIRSLGGKTSEELAEERAERARVLRQFREEERKKLFAEMEEERRRKLAAYSK